MREYRVVKPVRPNFLGLVGVSIEVIPRLRTSTVLVDVSVETAADEAGPAARQQTIYKYIILLRRILYRD